jgi:hypothetical protein
VEEPSLRAVVVVLAVAALLGVALVVIPHHDHPASVAVASAPVATEPTLAPPTTAVTGRGSATTLPPATAAIRTTTPTSTTGPAPATSTTDVGSLPQTSDKPAGDDALLVGNARGLFNAVVRDDPSLALPFFFPLSAYIQVKDISDPTHDYQTRLIPDYQQDVHSLHAQLGSDANGAEFVSINVPEDQAQWITPGVEYNKGSYWRVYGTTITYSVDGVTKSFPVTSLISWRGEWYAVHLGAIR